MAPGYEFDAAFLIDGILDSLIAQESVRVPDYAQPKVIDRDFVAYFADEGVHDSIGLYVITSHIVE